MWLSLDLFWRITETASQCKFHILRFVSAMHFQSYGLNVSVIEERHRNKNLKKKKEGTDFFFKEEEERRKKSQMQQNEGASYLEMEEIQKGARETRRGEIGLGDKESS